MRYMVIVISIVVFWILSATFLTYYLDDPVLTNPDLQGNSTLIIPDTSSINMTQLETPTETSLFSFVDALKIMFTFRMPVSNFPTGLAVFMSLLNWLLVVAFGISVYKIVNPISSA